jgi:hypothetical protein
VALVYEWLYRPSDGRLSAKLVPNFADRGMSHGQYGASPTAVNRVSIPELINSVALVHERTIPTERLPILSLVFVTNPLHFLSLCPWQLYQQWLLNSYQFRMVTFFFGKAHVVSFLECKTVLSPTGCLSTPFDSGPCWIGLFILIDKRRRFVMEKGCRYSPRCLYPDGENEGMHIAHV